MRDAAGADDYDSSQTHRLEVMLAAVREEYPCVVPGLAWSKAHGFVVMRQPSRMQYDESQSSVALQLVGGADNRQQCLAGDPPLASGVRCGSQECWLLPSDRL